MVLLPRRFSGFVILFAVSAVIFLLLHIEVLSFRLKLMQDFCKNLKPNNLSKNSASTQELLTVKSRNVIRVDAGISTFAVPNQRYNASQLNNTRHAVKDILFFNRVPKVGSQSMIALFHELADINDFRIYRDGPQKSEQVQLNVTLERHLATKIDTFFPPAAYFKHTSFTNFTRYGFSMPIYVNLVRDPVERVISWFYYVRAPWYIIERKQSFPELPLPSLDWVKKDFESCVMEGDRECRFTPGEYHNGVGDHRRQVMFFCGHHKKCLEFNGEWAMRRAQRNVEEYYAVVGVLEEMDVTIPVMEKFIPKFFKGATQYFYENLFEMQNINKNIYKPPVSEDIKDILRQNFTREIEFYEFCKQRLHKQYVSLMQLEKERRL